MKRLRLLVFVCLLALTAGCVGPATFKSSPTGEGYVTLTINWDTLAASSPMRPASFSPMALTDNVAIIGARIVAPDINAVLAQSATRQTAETQGVITIPVPATINAKLFAVAIDNDNHIVMLGYLSGITVQSATVLTITSDQLTWITPDAFFTGDIEWRTPTTIHAQELDPSEFEDGTLVAPDEIAGQGCGPAVECRMTISIAVSDPFGSSPSNPMICMSGSGITAPCYSAKAPVIDGWQAVTLTCYSTAETCSARPYVDGSHFSLGKNYYFDGDLLPLTIDWRP